MAPVSKPNICVDFDGMIHKYSKGWLDGSIYDSPVEGSHESLKLITNSGYNVVIFTSRLNPAINPDIEDQHEEILYWLDIHGFIRGVHFNEVTAMKPRALAYIDNKALKFETWWKTLKFFK